MTIAEKLTQTATWLTAKMPAKPDTAVVLGSGLGDFVKTLNGGDIPYAQIPNFPQVGVVGHAGRLVFGQLGPRNVIAFQGRVHLYEGHPVADTVFAVRTAIQLGAKTVILTNAAGGINAKFKAGDLMVIDDHLNLTGHNALYGKNEDALGPRFPDMSVAYDAELRALAHAQAKALGVTLQHGIYAGLLGPSYETPAEIRMLRTLGADAVGMSTVNETLAARHMGARVLGISCVTNIAAGLSSELMSHDDVQKVADQSGARFQSLLKAIIENL